MRPRRGPRRRAHDTASVAWTAVISSIVALVVAFFATGPFRADRTYARVLQAEAQAQNASKSISLSALVDSVGHKIASMIRANPWEPSYRQAKASFFVSLGTNAGIRGTSQALEFLGEGRDAYQRAAELAPDSPYVQEAYADGLARVREVMPNDASLAREEEVALRAAVRENPWRANVARKLRDLLESEGRLRDAVRVMQGTLSYFPKDIDLLRETARLEQRAGLGVDARALWRRLLAEKDDPEARGALTGHPITDTASSG